MKAAHSRSGSTIAVVLCLVVLGVAGLAATSLLQNLPNTYIKRFFEHAQAALSERVSLPSFAKQDDAPTDARSAYSGRSPSPYGALDSGAWQRQREDLSRSSPRNNLIAPPTAGSSSVQRSIDEADKTAAASATNHIAAQSLDSEVSPTQPAASDLNDPAPQDIYDKEIERKDLSRSPPRLNDAIARPIASSFPPAESSRVQARITAESAANTTAAQSPNAGASPAQTATPDVVAPAPRGISDKEIRFGIAAPFSG